MTQVNVTINGRQFRMACEDGEEAHLMELAEDLDRRIQKLRARFGEIGDTRLTVMAALTLADELAETKERSCSGSSRSSPRCRTPARNPPSAPWRPRRRSRRRSIRRPSASRASRGRLNETRRDDKIAMG